MDIFCICIRILSSKMRRIGLVWRAWSKGVGPRAHARLAVKLTPSADLRWGVTEVRCSTFSRTACAGLLLTETDKGATATRHLARAEAWLAADRLARVWLDSNNQLVRIIGFDSLLGSHLNVEANFSGQDIVVLHFLGGLAVEFNGSQHFLLSQLATSSTPTSKRHLLPVLFEGLTNEDFKLLLVS